MSAFVTDTWSPLAFVYDYDNSILESEATMTRVTKDLTQAKDREIPKSLGDALPHLLGRLH